MTKKPIECDAPVHVAPKIFKATVSLGGRKAWSISGDGRCVVREYMVYPTRKLSQRSDIKGALSREDASEDHE